MRVFQVVVSLVEEVALKPEPAAVFWEVLVLLHGLVVVSSLSEAPLVSLVVMLVDSEFPIEADGLQLS